MEQQQQKQTHCLHCGKALTVPKVCLEGTEWFCKPSCRMEFYAEGKTAAAQVKCDAAV